uniref:Alpha/beta hydrolase fold-3 domain-containing protein n=1 Tax=Leersia perrieri TaxID=77586 RepID=A0A0D9UWW0_9ORYZ
MATAAASNTSVLSMKLLIDTKAQRVLFAEASKDVVDFLFSLLALPVGTAVKLLGKDSMVGCVGNLYISIEKLDDMYVQAGASKDALLSPTVLSPAASNSSVLRLPAPSTEQNKSFFRCGYNYNNYNSSCRSYVTDTSGTKCPSCSNQMTTECYYVEGDPAQKAQNAAAEGAKGFVQGIVTYTVMDDLTVSPMSSISSITLLNTFAVKDLGALKEKTVQLGYTEGLAILRASLQSKTVLSDPFSSLITLTSLRASTMSGDNMAPHVVEDFAGVIQLFSDGTVVRGDDSAFLAVPGAVQDLPGVQWKDVVYDATHNLTVRLPVLVYFHGGGYCIGAPDQPPFHNFCLRAAGELPAVVLSVQYRLAPEHRLPAAIDDGAAFFTWLRGQAAGAGADTWLAESADFARTFISGLSAGANLAHHVTVRVASGRPDVDPVRVVGYVLIDAFFGGVERTAAEANTPASVPSLTVEMADQFWRMALPVGATRDHPVANPFGPESPSLEPVALPPALVVVSGGDVLRDRLMDYVARLKGMGKEVELAEFEGEHHGFSVLQPWSTASGELIQVLKQFKTKRRRLSQIANYK